MKSKLRDVLANPFTVGGVSLIVGLAVLAIGPST